MTDKQLNHYAFKVTLLWVCWTILFSGNLMIGGALSIQVAALLMLTLVSTVCLYTIYVKRHPTRQVSVKPTLLSPMITLSPSQLQQHKARREGYVYLLRSSEGLYKIGHTTDPIDRIRTFNVKLPFDVEYEHIIKCADRHQAESDLHRKYKSKRVRGEWFRLTPDDVAAIKAIERM